MKKIGRMLAALLAAVLLCAAMGVLFVACGEGTEEPPQTDPVKVADGIDFDLAVGAEREFAVADYITANGNTVSASSAEETVASAAVEGGTLTVSALSAGETDVTLTCGDVTVTFGVTVYRTFTVSVDGEETQVREGGTFELPAAIAPEDQNFEFVAWQVGQEQKQPGAEITVNENLTITAVTRRKAPVKVKDGETFVIAFGGNKQITVADYITTYGNAVSASVTPEGIVAASVAGGVLTVTAIRSGEAKVTLSCGEVEAVFGFTVQKPDVDAPAYANGTISFDLFNAASGSFTFVPTAPEGVSYTYAYSLAEQDGNAQISDGALTYTATEPVSKVLTVNVTATATVSGETIEKQGSFTVTITVTDTTPAVIESAIAADGTVDLYDHADGYTIDLTANIENAGNVTSYTVAVGDEEAAPVENAEEYVFTGSYSDTAQQVTLTVTALFGEKSVSYTYTLSVIDSTAYRMPNGALEDVTGWSGMTGIFSNNSTYWDKHETNNDGYYYVGVDGATDTLSGTETVTSPTFVVGGSGWITFKLGSMRPNEGTTLRNIYLEVVEDAADGDDVVLARVRNILFKDPEAALRLNDYKLDLSAYKGKTVYLRAVDNEKGDNFRSLYLDSFVTWYAAEPAADTYTDLSKAYYLDTAAAFDLAQTNTATVVPVLLSEGLLNKEYTYAAKFEGDGLTADGLALKATKSGVYTVTYTVSYGEEEIGSFSVTVTVTNTTPLPEFENAVHSYAYGEWQADTAVEVPLPEDGKRFSYSYSVSAGEASIDGKTLTYTPSTAGSVQITVTVTLKDEKYTVTDLPTLSFTVTLNFADSEIALADGDSISVAFDVNDAEIADKEAYTLDFARYLVIPADKTVSYAVTMNEKSIVLDGSSYTLVFAKLELNETEQEFVFAVTATSGGKQLEYTVTLHIKDTYQYRLYNGGFDLDLDGWTLNGTMDNEKNDAALGGISEETGYWENDPSGVDPLFYNDGKFFSAYAYTPGETERATGTLRSSNFIIGGSGWITYKLGGAKNIEQVYLEVVSADREKRVKLPNFDWSNNAGNLVRGCTLVSYRADLIEYGFTRGEEVYLLLTDNGTNDYGLFFLDSVVTYYPVGSEPDDSFNLVSKYRLYNGGFETGSLMGWELTGDIGVVTDDDNYWNDPNNVYGKNGRYLFSWYTNEDRVSREDATGTLQSRVFTLKKNAIVSFLLGGGLTGVSLEFVRPAADGAGEEVLARFTNQQFDDGRLISYYYQFDLGEDTQCFVRVIDQAADDEGIWRCFALDGVETYLAKAPAGYKPAVNQLSADV